MTFSAGELCCVSDACVMLDTTPDSGSASWDVIPHVTRIAFTETASTPKLVTSSTGGAEISGCGNVSRTGTLEIACHNGEQPGVLCINQTFHIMWSIDCANINIETPVHPFYRAIIRITSVPVDFNIAGNQPVIYQYGFDIIQWLDYPTCQSGEEAGAGGGFDSILGPGSESV